MCSVAPLAGDPMVIGPTDWKRERARTWLTATAVAIAATVAIAIRTYACRGTTRSA